VGNANSSEIDRSERVERLRAEPLVERVGKEESPELREQLRVAAGIAELVREFGGRALVVGGFARDEALRLMIGRGEKSPWLVDCDIRSKDIDLEVYGIEYEELATVAAQFGDFDVRGEQFRVLNIRGVDVSIPRRDSKIAPGHRGFKIEGDPSMSFREASRRRDFTVNALAVDPRTGEFLDEWGGVNDLREGILRAVDPKTFPDDPVRPLRGAQLVARFGFRIDPETAAVCRRVSLQNLPKGRVGEEWNKLLRAARPGLGLNAMLELGVLDQLHPELRAVADDPQRWERVCAAVDDAVKFAEERGLDRYEKRDFVGAVICSFLEGSAAEKFLAQINISKKRARKIVPMAVEYLPLKRRWESFSEEALSDETVRRLAVGLCPASVREFCQVLQVIEGQEAKLPGKLLLRAQELGVEERPPVPILTGDDLKEMGIPEGRELGGILHEVYGAQLEGRVSGLEEARQLAEELWEREGV